MEGKRQLEKRDFGKRLSLDSSLVVSTKYSLHSICFGLKCIILCDFLNPMLSKASIHGVAKSPELTELTD